MNSIDFVKNKIDLLVGRFANIQCKYEFDQFSNVHLVEVIPNSIYKIDKEYSFAESEIIRQFNAMFPAENICFVTDDSLVRVGQPIYIKEGTGFALFEIYQKHRWDTIPWANYLKFKVPSKIFFSSFFSPVEVTSLDYLKSSFADIELLRKHNFKFSNRIPLPEFFLQENNRTIINDIEEKVEQSGNNSFAMAA